MKHMTYIIVGGIVGLLAIWAAGSYLVVRNLEAPKYSVVEKRTGYEIRQYEPYIVAETTVTTDSYRQDLSSGFSVVADYIFGNNTKQEPIAMTTPVLEEEDKNEKIAMTVPVLEAQVENATRTIAFVLPSKYTLDTLPTPNNDRVTLREVPGKKVAVLRFTWYGTPARVAAKKAELETLLKTDGTTIVGQSQAAFYNPPLSMPLVLRNEILIPIE